MNANAISHEEYDHALDLAEGDLLELGSTLNGGAPQDSLFLTSALALGTRARTLFTGFIRLIPSDAPVAALALLRPTIEINLTLRFLVKNPDIHTEMWIAEGERQVSALVREIDADPEMLRKAGGEGLISQEWHDDKTAFVAAVRTKALAAGIGGVGASGSVMPSMWSIAYEHGDQTAREAYTMAYRSLSPAVHTSARSFQHGEFVPVDGDRVTYRELSDPDREIRRHRALNATTFASTLCVLSEPLQLGTLEHADAIKNALMAITTE